MPSAPLPPPLPPPAATPSKPEFADESFVLSLPDDPASDNDWYLWAGVLALLVFVAFFPAATGRFIWDDDHHAGLIPYYQSLGGLKEIWTPQAATPQYYPLTFTTYWIEFHLWQSNTLGYHVDNILLHAASAILVWRLLRRLKIGGAWVAAAIWAVHPLQVESIAWISERKNVLSGLLFFAAIWFYLEFDGWTPAAKGSGPGLSADGSTFLLGDRRVAYALSLVCFVLALLAKTVACAMPAVILILAWWRGRKLLDRKEILPLIPFFAAGLALAGMTVFLETAANGNVQARGPDWALDPIQRLLIAGRGLWFYVAKLVWPARLTFSYPRVVPSPDMGAGGYAVQWLYVIAAIAVIAGLWLGRRHWGRGPLAAVLYYVVTLFPALGFINIFPMRYSFVADHFQYLSGLGLIVLAVAALGRGMRSIKLPTPAVTALAAAALVALFVPAWLQAHVYESPETLWRDTLAKNPTSWMAYDNLGVELITLGEQKQRDAAADRRQGDSDDATADAQQAQDDFAEAEQRLRQALQLRSRNYATHNALGLLYRTLGRWQDAESEAHTAVMMDQQDDPSHQLIAPYLNYIQVMEHNHPDFNAQPWLDTAMAIANQPHSRLRDAAVAHVAYGDYWLKQAARAQSVGDSAKVAYDLHQGIDHLTAGLQTIPDDIPALYDLAQAYQGMGLIDQAKAAREQANGQSEQAAGDEYKSHNVDDVLAMQNYMSILKLVPFQRYAPALEGIGELNLRNTVERDNQADAVGDLLVAMQFFKDALATDPAVPGAAERLSGVKRALLDQAAKARAHAAEWDVLRLKAEPLAKGEINKAAAAAAEQAARDVLWPLPKTHALRPAISDFRAAVAAYLDPHAPADAADKVHSAAVQLLAAMEIRTPAIDAVDDAMMVALCYEGVVEADENSAPAWRDLRAQADVLGKAIAAQPSLPGAQEALRVAQSVLDQHRSATQPASQPSTSPTAQ